MSEKAIVQKIIKLSKEIVAENSLVDSTNMGPRARKAFEKLFVEVVKAHSVLGLSLEFFDDAEDFIERQNYADDINDDAVSLTRDIDRTIKALERLKLDVNHVLKEAAGRVK